MHYRSVENKSIILCIDSSRKDLEFMLEMLNTQLGDRFVLKTAKTADEGMRSVDRILTDNQDIALVLASQSLADSRGDIFLHKVYERWPHSIRILLAERDEAYSEKLLDDAQVYRVFYKPLDNSLFKSSIMEAARHYLQRKELTEKSRILTELHRASLSLTGEIHLPKLLHKLMRIVIDNADALNGYIILERDNGNLFIEAEGHSGSYTTEVKLVEISDFSPVCPAIVEYARKLRENVILNDAMNEGIFASHPFIRKNLSRSILCAPLVYQGKLFGLLYLDNNEKTHAFSAYSIELLRLLSAPAAIAIQNAMLYASLEAKVEERTREVNLQKQEIERQHNEIKMKNDDIMSSIRYARRIQDAYLPRPADVKKVFPESFIYYKPKDIVSGDFFWFSKRLSKVILVAADCTGHGIPGAFMTVMANTLLRQIVEIEGIFKPEQILYHLHLRIKVALQQEYTDEVNKDGVDIAVCQIDPVRKKLLYAGANRPLLLIRNKEIIEFKPDKYGVGGVQNEDVRDYTAHAIELEENDTIYLFSDGYQDQIGQEINKRFRSKRFYNLLLDIHTKELDHQRLLLDAELRHWRGEMEQTDDIVVIGVRF